MDAPPDPTELEIKLDPGNYHLPECLPTGELPNLSHLGRPEQQVVRSLCHDFGKLFSQHLGLFKGVCHNVDVSGNSPIKQYYYRCSPEKLKIMRQEVDDMLDMGVVHPSRSEWASPLILVKKPNGTWRPCVDYRRVNDITKGEAYPLPRLDDLIDQVGNAPFITTLDLSKGYWQIPLTERAKRVSAFITPFGLYEFSTMPFGLKLAPMTFQRAMNQVLQGLESFAVAYLDDIAVRSSSWLAHIQHLRVVFQRLRAAGLTLNAKKCVVGGGSVQYFGYRVGSGHIAPVTAKVEAISRISPPTTKKQLRSFLGAIGFYRRFIPYFSMIASPLTDLLKGGRRADIHLEWSDTCEQAFRVLKKSLVTEPVLKAPDFGEPFEVYTDASEIGIAAVLTQNEDEMPKPVSFFSRKLLPREQHYSTVEKELLAIIAALDMFRVYVGFGPITIHSDHRPLVWLRRCTTANQRVLRWALTLAEFDITVEHVRGVDNCLADLLSRQC
jgi:hypothetical protein